MMDEHAAKAATDHELVVEYRERLARHAIFENKDFVAAIELRNIINEMCERGFTDKELNNLHKH